MFVETEFGCIYARKKSCDDRIFPSRQFCVDENIKNREHDSRASADFLPGEGKVFHRGKDIILAKNTPKRGYFSQRSRKNTIFGLGGKSHSCPPPYDDSTSSCLLIIIYYELKYAPAIFRMCLVPRKCSSSIFDAETTLD